MGWRKKEPLFHSLLFLLFSLSPPAVSRQSKIFPSPSFRDSSSSLGGEGDATTSSVERGGIPLCLATAASELAESNFAGKKGRDSPKSGDNRVWLQSCPVTS